MNRLALFVALGLLAGAAHGSTFELSDPANEMYNEGYAVVAMPGVAKEVQHFPPGIEKAMIKNDFAWAAKNRKAILSEWQKRYDTKSDPKS